MKLVQKIAITYIRTRLSILAAFSKRKAAAEAFELFCTPAKQPRIPLSPLFLEAEPLSLTIEGITLAGFRWNKGGGRRLQIVHGYESASQKFEIYIQAFIQKGYEVLVFDAPAHGLSGGKQITLPLYIDALREVYRQYGPVQSFFAHSFGGLALVHFLETITPDTSARVALVAPATETSTAIDGLFKQLHLGPEVRKEFDGIVRGKSNADPGYYSISRAIDHIKMPVLWIHDRHDTITPLADVQPIIGRNNPQLRFLITDGFGHRRIYREESVVNAVTDFL